MFLTDLARRLFRKSVRRCAPPVLFDSVTGFQRVRSSTNTLKILGISNGGVIDAVKSIKVTIQDRDMSSPEPAVGSSLNVTIVP